MRPRITMMVLIALFAVFALGAVSPSTSPAVPAENVDKGSGPPPFDAAEPGARRLLEAIKTGDPALADGFFFPADAFDLVKAMAMPGRYHRKLVTWYGEDILEEHARFADPSWVFEKLERGRCKWQEKGTEGNALAYWSCRGNRVTARSGEKTRTFEIHVIINWGKDWYVTHLGKIRNP